VDDGRESARSYDMLIPALHAMGGGGDDVPHTVGSIAPQLTDTNTEQNMENIHESLDEISCFVVSDFSSIWIIQLPYRSTKID
jgi:hypothetical protein